MHKNTCGLWSQMQPLSQQLHRIYDSGTTLPSTTTHLRHSQMWQHVCFGWTFHQRPSWYSSICHVPCSRILRPKRAKIENNRGILDQEVSTNIKQENKEYRHRIPCLTHATGEWLGQEKLAPYRWGTVYYHTTSSPLMFLAAILINGIIVKTALVKIALTTISR